MTGAAFIDAALPLGRRCLSGWLPRVRLSWDGLVHLGPAEVLLLRGPLSRPARTPRVTSHGRGGPSRDEGGYEDVSDCRLSW